MFNRVISTILCLKKNKDVIQIVIHVQTVVSAHVYLVKNSEEMTHKWQSVDTVIVGRIALILEMESAVSMHMNKWSRTLKC